MHLYVKWSSTDLAAYPASGMRYRSFVANRKTRLSRAPRPNWCSIRFVKAFLGQFPDSVRLDGWDWWAIRRYGERGFGFYDTTCTPSIDWSSMLGIFESHTDLPGS
jgi:hypothetical protein